MLLQGACGCGLACLPEGAEPEAAGLVAASIQQGEPATVVCVGQSRETLVVSGRMAELLLLLMVELRQTETA